VDNKITQEELKEFWKYFGWEYHTYPEIWNFGKLEIEGARWITPDKKGAVIDMPKLDLNNLEEYCFPKLIDMDYEFNFYFFQSTKEWQVDIFHTPTRKTYTAKEKTLEDAIYNAIVEVIKNG
jgi:hypothetical protein